MPRMPGRRTLPASAAWSWRGVRSGGSWAGAGRLAWGVVRLPTAWAILLLIALAPLTGSRLAGATSDEVVLTYHFNRDVRPILSENCFSCHGPDASKRKAHLALNDRASATSLLGSGVHAIVPGEPQASELLRRICTTDAADHMPPEETGHHLTPSQIAILRTWILEGARYEEHWSYVAPHAVTPPRLPPGAAPPAIIDAFIADRLKAEGLQPSPPADAVTLVRRLSFDLTGLPPSTEDVDSFSNDHSADAYEHLVDRFLASPQYGERMAVGWLDLVRYADSVGYHSDNARNVTPYRDWVIAAFNSNLPFDEFTREQLAGDLLPDPTLAQKVATTYNRLLMTTEEVGAQAAEYEAKSAADRVRNLASVWLGSTMKCCECHDHKYDPFSTRDFYNLEAFFADIQEPAIGPRETGMAVPTPEQAVKLSELDRSIATLQTVLDTTTPLIRLQQAMLGAALAPLKPLVYGPWYRIGPFRAPTFHAAFATAFDPEQAVALGAPRSDGLAWTAEPSWSDNDIHQLPGGDLCATYLYRTIQSNAVQQLHLSLGSDDSLTVWVNGRLALSHEIGRDCVPGSDTLDVTLAAGINRLLLKIGNASGGYAVYCKGSSAAPHDILLIAAKAAPSPAESERFAAYVRSIAPSLAAARGQMRILQAKRTALLDGMEHTLITQGGPPRVVHVKVRGNWMEDAGPPCEPLVPHFLAQICAAGRPTRLDLANWLVAPGNPLVARVTINRLWKQFFGVGLVKTMDDFGTQGDTPSNQALLDWLAVDFTSHGWDMKRSIRNMLLSNTYRQSSLAGELAVRDPDNRLVARQSRFRLDAEFVRDTALSISGLLVDRIGGPSVKPYQPEGYWTLLNFPPREWVNDQGEDAYRRGLYTFWQRTLLHPSLLAFDAPSREECTVERARSNTPQQALVLLNDPTYVEAARCFAEEMIRQGGDTDVDRISWGYRRALSRLPSGEELAIHLRLLDAHRALYMDSPDSAVAVSRIGQHPTPSDIDVRELAAWTSVARVILNLYDTISRN